MTQYKKCVQAPATTLPLMVNAQVCTIKYINVQDSKIYIKARLFSATVKPPTNPTVLIDSNVLQQFVLHYKQFVHSLQTLQKSIVGNHWANLCDKNGQTASGRHI